MRSTTTKRDTDMLQMLANVGVTKATAARSLHRDEQWVGYWSHKARIEFRRFHAPTHPWQTELAIARLHSTMSRLNSFAKGADNHLLAAGTVGR